MQSHVTRAFGGPGALGCVEMSLPVRLHQVAKDKALAIIDGTAIDLLPAGASRTASHATMRPLPRTPLGDWNQRRPGP